MMNHCEDGQDGNGNKTDYKQARDQTPPSPFSSSSPSSPSSPPFSAHRGWAFRRFGADKQAQTSADTWDELHHQGLSILSEIDQHDGSLYEAKHLTEESMHVIGIPRIADCATAARQTTAAARDLLTTLPAANPPSDGGPDTEAVHIVPMNAQQVAALRNQLTQWINEAGRLSARTISAIESTNATRKRLGNLDSRVRDFILTIWALNAEMAKAFPPFMANIGPIESTLYGIGRTTTTTTTSGSSAPAPETNNTRANGETHGA